MTDEMKGQEITHSALDEAQGIPDEVIDALGEHFASAIKDDPMPVGLPAEIMEQIRAFAEEGVVAAPGTAGVPLTGPRPFAGVSIEQFDRTDPTLELEVTLGKEHSFILVQPMVTEDGGVRFHVLTDASVPELLDVLGKTHNIVNEGWTNQQEEIAKRDAAAESYFRTRSAHCQHTPDGEGAEIDSCHQCWREAGSPLLPPIDGLHNPDLAPEVEGTEVIDGHFGGAPVEGIVVPGYDADEDDL